MPDYCYFRDRCEMQCDKCGGEYPPEIAIGDTHIASCWRHADAGEVIRYPKSVDLEGAYNGN
jgi:peptide/nickel transport system ATP-binding protein